MLVLVSCVVSNSGVSFHGPFSLALQDDLLATHFDVKLVIPRSLSRSNNYCLLNSYFFIFYLPCLQGTPLVWLQNSLVATLWANGL